MVHEFLISAKSFWPDDQIFGDHSPIIWQSSQKLFVEINNP
jgi:hypothetical protein